MSILTEFAAQEPAIHENFDMNNALHRLESIQESSTTLSGRLIYEAEMLPVFSIDNSDGEPVFCVEADMFKKMLDSKEITIAEGIDQLFEAVSMQDKDCESKSNLAIAFKEENIMDIDHVVKSDPSKFAARCESVIHRVDVMDEIISEGVNIVII